MKRVILSLFIVLSCLYAFSASPVLGARILLSPSEQAWLHKHPQVRVRISATYPPFEFFDQGRYQGMAVDYLHLIGEKLGITFVPVDLTWAESMDGLRRREGIDLILLVTHTPEREADMNFTHDYINFPWVIFSRKDTGFIGQLSDLKDKTVAVEKGFITREWLKRDLPEVRFRDVADTVEALKAVSMNAADAYVGNLAVGTYVIEKDGLVNLKVAAPAPYGSDPLAMAVRKDWPELATLIDRALFAMTPKERQTIQNKWLSLRVEYGLQVMDILKWVGIVGGVAFLWIVQLRWMVRQRTRQLRHEIRLRRTKETALMAQSDQMNAIFDSLEAIVYVADITTMQLISLNRYGCSLFGEDWGGKKCYEVFQINQDRLCPFCNNDRIVIGEKPQPYQLREFFNEKTGRWYQAIDRVIPWPDGRMVKLVIAFDVTDRKEMDRIKDEMLSVVSHEVNTPLTAMMGFAEMMMENDIPQAQQKEYLDIIYQESERLADLFDNFITLQSVKMGLGETFHHRIQIQPLLERTVDLFRNLAPGHQISLALETALPEVDGDSEYLFRVFINLVSNAVKYSPQGGAVRVTASVQSANLVIRVSDEGVGISPPEQERIFDPFYRVDNRDSRTFGGMGLGLALVREIMDKHGGKVWVESSGARGSSFFISLPLPESLEAQAQSLSSFSRTA